MMEENHMREYDQLSDASGGSESSDESMDRPPSFTAMASSGPQHWINSIDESQKLLDTYITIYERDHCELQQCIESLTHLINTFEEDFRSATENTRDLGLLGITGGVAVIAGLVLAPFSLGASAVVSGAGAAVAFGGGVGGGIMNLMKNKKQKKLREDVKNRLEEFQNKITPMTDILKVISQYTNELQSVTNKPEHKINVVSKWVATGSELLRIVRIDDIGEVAAQMSKAVRLAGTLTGIFAGVSLVLDLLSVIEDNKTLDDMDKLARNGQISESEIKSAAGKFVVEMRKAIHSSQNIMDEIEENNRLNYKWNGSSVTRQNETM